MPTEKINLQIEGMSCEGCKRTVTIAIEELKGIESVNVDLTKAEAEIVFDSLTQTREKIIEAVNQTGIYKAWT